MWYLKSIFYSILYVIYKILCILFYPFKKEEVIYKNDEKTINSKIEKLKYSINESNLDNSIKVRIRNTIKKIENNEINDNNIINELDELINELKNETEVKDAIVSIKEEVKVIKESNKKVGSENIINNKNETINKIDNIEVINKKIDNNEIINNKYYLQFLSFS